MIDQKSWVKKHKKDFANSLITKSGAEYDGNSSAIFMAGLPGAGKTEFTKNLIKTSDLKIVRLDMDEIAEQIDGYRPEIADRYRGSASELLNKTFDQTLKRGLDFIMDGTFGSQHAINNIERAFGHGYRVKIIYIFQDPKRAWNFTLAREKVEHRAISKEGFIESYFNILKNIKDVMDNYCDKIVLDVIIKDNENKVGEWQRNIGVGDIDNIIKNSYNKETLGSYISD